jgi:glycosyltransferase involved in cell wall biosynthesis
MKYSNIIFIDHTSDRTHINIKNIAIGGSEYQLYNLIYQLSREKKDNIIRCFNYINGTNNIIDNIEYNNFEMIKDLSFNTNNKIVFQRFFPNESYIREKVINSTVFIWIHDIADSCIFLGNDSNLINYYKERPDEYKDFLVKNFLNNKNIKFIFNSKHCKYLFIEYLSKYGITLEYSRFGVIYNILYKDEFEKLDNLKIDKNSIVYASSWQKGLDKVVYIFDHILKHDNTYKLIIMSPGYGIDNNEEYKQELLNRFKNNIVICGSLPKKKYSEIIKSSLCVMSSVFNETFGCVFAESYYLGTPVIADLKSGAVKEIIDNNYIVDYENINQVIEKIDSLRIIREYLNIKLDNKFLLNENLLLWKNILFD